MTKTIVVKKKKDTEYDNARYWLDKTYQERLDALEEIRREYNQWKYNTQPRFQRVYRIIKRKQS